MGIMYNSSVVIVLYILYRDNCDVISWRFEIITRCMIPNRSSVFFVCFIWFFYDDHHYHCYYYYSCVTPISFPFWLNKRRRSKVRKRNFFACNFCRQVSFFQECYCWGHTFRLFKPRLDAFFPLNCGFWQLWELYETLWFIAWLQQQLVCACKCTKMFYSRIHIRDLYQNFIHILQRKETLNCWIPSPTFVLRCVWSQ